MTVQMPSPSPTRCSESSWAASPTQSPPPNVASAPLRIVSRTATGTITTTSVQLGPGSPVRWGTRLPDQYKPDGNERCIELPLAWQLFQGRGCVLDAGCALNFDALAKHFENTFVHLTLGGRDEDRNPARQYIIADLRRLPMPTGSCASIACVSTLEHVGMDNRHYRGPCEDDPESVWYAVRELRRVLAPGGLLMITVPCGTGGIHLSGKWQAFHLGQIYQMGDCLRPSRVDACFYRRHEDGWQLTTDLVQIQRPAWENEKTVVGLCAMKVTLQ